MQTVDDEELHQVVELLCETGECLFGLGKNGAILRPLASGFQS